MSQYDNHALTRTPGAFTREVRDRATLTRDKPLKIHHFYLESANAASITGGGSNTATFFDEYTWNLPLDQPIAEGRLLVERMHIFTGNTGGASTSIYRICLPNLPGTADTIFDSTTNGRRYVLPLAPSITVNNNNISGQAVPPFADSATVRISNVPAGTFPFTCRLETTAAGSSRTPISRVHVWMDIIEDS